MSNTVLINDYEGPSRPYSQKELNNLRESFFRRLGIGNVRIEHSNSCGHFYFTKTNGKKEKESKEKGVSDVGNCSVCWKISKTPRNLKTNAHDLVYYFSTAFYDVPTTLDHGLFTLEHDFYTWLYNEFNPDKKPVKSDNKQS